MPWNKANYAPQYYKYIPVKLKKTGETDNAVMEESNDERLTRLNKEAHEYFENMKKSKIHKYFASFNNNF